MLQKIKNIVDSHVININEKDVFNFLQNTKRWPLYYPWGQPSVEIITNIGKTAVDFFRVYNGSRAAYLDFNEWYRYYSLGYTTVMSNIFDLTLELRKLADDLTNATGSSFNANFYFSKPGQIPSFLDHSHPYDVIAKQIYGNSTWRVNDKKIKLKKNYSLIIPANAIHSVIDKSNKKLSLTINIEEGRSS
jgi:mannose-6-phosphate isomerase-like protein (cupin superfamily)